MNTEIKELTIYPIKIKKEELLKAFKDEESFYKYLDNLCDILLNRYYTLQSKETKRP